LHRINSIDSERYDVKLLLVQVCLCGWGRVVTLQKYIGWQALKDDLTAMYLQAFTEAELDQMNAFYSSPTGQKVLQRLPELVRQRNQLAMQRLQEHIGELQQAVGAAPGN